MMIDLDRLERRLAAADGDIVAVTKTVMSEMIAEMRIGRADRRAKAIELAVGGMIGA